MSFGKVSDSHKEEVNKFGLEMYSWEEFLQKVSYMKVYTGYLAHNFSEVLD